MFHLFLHCTTPGARPRQTNYCRLRVCSAAVYRSSRVRFHSNTADCSVISVKQVSQPSQVLGIDYFAYAFLVWPTWSSCHPLDILTLVDFTRLFPFRKCAIGDRSQAMPGAYRNFSTILHCSLIIVIPIQLKLIRSRRGTCNRYHWINAINRTNVCFIYKTSSESDYDWSGGEFASNHLALHTEQHCHDGDRTRRWT